MKPLSEICQMQRLDTYLFKQVGLVFLFTTITVVFVVLFTQSFRLLSFVIDNSGTALVFFQLMGLMMMTFLPVVAPISMGIATVFTYNKLAVESELVVMRSIGASPLHLARPAITLAFLVMIGGYMLSLWIAPMSSHNLVSIQYELRDNFSIFLVKSGAFNDLSDGLTFYSRDKGANGSLEGILIHDIRNPKRPVTIMAERGQFILNEKNVPEVIVYNGKRQEVTTETGKLSQMDFDRYVVEMDVAKKTSSRLPDPRELQTAALIFKLFEDDSNLSGKSTPPHLLAELHQRLTTPLLSLTFSMIGLTSILAGPFNRRGMTKRILIAAFSIVFIQAAVLSLDNLMPKHPWVATLLYAIAILPIPLCSAVMGMDYLAKKPILTRLRGRKGAP
jgi:lipopolysaccharide export system permease protein